MSGQIPVLWPACTYVLAACGLASFIQLEGREASEHLAMLQASPEILEHLPLATMQRQECQ